ncbi:hypothetical protein [uncultured Cohaesibacter sp.]|uniref:hypothetical protein n=1 Tax=uncultured Cohaesibacter sp. TaxID=1002546 RepID=UPI0029C7C5DB|nr:hypothetical protein [uncultured Cohaesibacter sp.]
MTELVKIPYLQIMMMTQQIVQLADRYSKHVGIAVSTLSMRLFCDSQKIDNLRAGKDLLTKRFEAAVQFFDENWPVDVEWPSDIPRPSVAEREEAPAA